MFASKPRTPLKVIAVACGGNHIIAVAQDPQSFHGKLCTSGWNDCGQLGLGDMLLQDQMSLVSLQETITCFKAANIHILVTHYNITGRR